MDTPAEARTPSGRRRWRRAAGLGAAAVLALAAVVYAMLLGPQSWSYLTHRTGSPEHNVDFVPFAADDPPAVHLAVAGDVGDGGDMAWRLAATMYVAGREHPYDALLLLGDQVYPWGDPAKLDDYVFRPFAAVLDAGARLLAICGNHDAAWEDGGAGQMQALGMPGMWWSTEIGDVLIVGLDSNRPDDPAQLGWLEATLAASTHRWKIVAIHEPPYSAGYQGSNEDVRDIFTPVFERYGVNLVLSGHEHDYQRSVLLGGVTYVVSGGGADTRRTGRAGFTAYSTSVINFVDIGIYPDRIELRGIDHELKIFDECVIGA